MYWLAWCAVFTIFTRRHIWSLNRCLERMYDLNVTIQHYGSLRIIRINTYSLESGGLSVICDCQHHHKDGNLWNKIDQDFGKFNSLGNTLTDSRSNMSLSLCLLITLMKQHLYRYTYKVETEQRETMTCNYWYRHSQPLGRSQVSTELSFRVSDPYLVRFYFHVGTII